MDKVLAVHQDRDAFYSLISVEKKMTHLDTAFVSLNTWDLVTGKKMRITGPKQKDLQKFIGFERFNKENPKGDPNLSGINQYHLLVSTEPEAANERRLNALFQNQ